MSRLRFKGQIFYANLLPVPQADVEIIDKDVGGNGDDVLWSGHTNDNGVFEGRTRDWEDRNVARVTILGFTIESEVPDVLLLWFKVRKRGMFQEGPFLRVNDEQSLPIYTLWAPMDVAVSGTVRLLRNQEPVAGAEVTLYALDPGRQPIREVLTTTTNTQGHFGGLVDFTTAFPVVTVITSLVLGFEVKKGSDSWPGVMMPYFNNTIFVPWGLNPLLWRIIDHGPDVAGREVVSNKRNQVETFNFASVSVDRDKRHHYIDSGQRFAFRLNDGVVEYREANPGSNFTDNWQVFISESATHQRAMSYLTKRDGEPIEVPRFDIIVVGGNRILAKENGRDRFFFTIIDPLFWQYKDRNEPMGEDEICVPGIYFKLDPEIGVAGTSNEELVNQIDEEPPGSFNNHPVTIRFGVYRRLIGTGWGGMMVVRKIPRLWYQLDSRPPACTLAEIPDKFPTYPHIIYENSLATVLISEEESIDFEAVLDLGVGSVHLHEQYSEIYGGEMQPLLTDAFGIKFYMYIYQFFNGQVRDGDGFIDGTCNYYMLCRLRRSDSKRLQKYALLFIDEQSFFSNRWRAVDPEDCEPSDMRSWLLGKPNFLFTAELKSKEALYRVRYGYEYDKFWDPFASGCIDDDSRLAVACQVVAINGNDSGAHQIYTINYSWGTCDRTWRWRGLPEGTKARIVETQEDPEDIDVETRSRVLRTPGRLSNRRLPDVDDECLVYPQTIKIRDDTTLVLKGTKSYGSGVSKRYYSGRYFQKYLPSDLKMPDPSPGEHRKPEPFNHNWQFVPESIFKRMDSYSHFGVYEKVDSRSQYYCIELSESDAAKLEPDAVWEDIHKVLHIRCPRINWADLSRLADGDLQALLPFQSSPSSPFMFVPRLPSVEEDVRPLSMFNPGTFFRITRKKGLGDKKQGIVSCIATFWDKRDDDLIQVSNPLPVTVKLQKRNSNVEIRAKFKKHRDVFVPPLVKKATLTLRRQQRSGKILSASVKFELPRQIYRRGGSQPPDIKSMIWRVVVCALGEPDSQEIKTVFDCERDGEFQATPDRNSYICDFNPSAAEEDLLRRYFLPENHWKSGASIWFEDVVGQKNIAEETVFKVIE